MLNNYNNLSMLELHNKIEELIKEEEYYDRFLGATGVGAIIGAGFLIKNLCNLYGLDLNEYTLNIILRTYLYTGMIGISTLFAMKCDKKLDSVERDIEEIDELIRIKKADTIKKYGL